MTKAVLVGRFCPVHLGHQKVLHAMVEEFGGENCLVGIGSCDHAVSVRHFFSYEERRRFLLKVAPEVKIFGIPDYPTDEEWMLALDDILGLAKSDVHEVIFFGGCQEDVEFFYRFGRSVKIMNRFDGTTPKISATEVRDALIQERPLKDLLDPSIEREVQECFRLKWEKFKKL